MEERNASRTANFTQQKWDIPEFKLKAFELIPKKLATAGITASLTDQSYPLNGAILCGFLSFGSGIYFTTAYDAETFAEYTHSVYVCSLFTLITFVLLILILKVKQLFEFIDRTDDLVNISEFAILLSVFCMLWWRFFVAFLALKYSASKSIFTETVQTEQRLSKIIFLVAVQMTPTLECLPFFLYSNFLFFTTDLGSEAFQLPSPTR